MSSASRRYDPAVARAAVDAIRDWIADPDSVAAPGRNAIALAVRQTARMLAHDAPGHSVEVRVPPFVAVQCIAGLQHHRGTPPNVVECSPIVWLRLVTGVENWDEAAKEASGSRVSEVSAMLPLLPLQGGK
ncbi:MAG: sterol carrier family protein [Corynebacterium sp.]|nr:sterol carrier family protein [Corynebacterium sp.]